jgi:hypothetical protein
MELEEALDLCYRGKRNVAKAAAEVGIPLAEMKDALCGYIAERPVDAGDPVVWSGDVELGWPWV